MVQREPTTTIRPSTIGGQDGAAPGTGAAIRTASYGGRHTTFEVPTGARRGDGADEGDPDYAAPNYAEVGEAVGAGIPTGSRQEAVIEMPGVKRSSLGAT